MSHNSARLLTAFFGVSSHGRVLVPINFRLNVSEVGYIVEHSGATVLLVDPELADTFASVRAKHTFVLGTPSEAELYRFGTQPEPWELDEDATATINYTSGTTARPKGVQLTHRNLWINAATFGWQMGINDRDVYLHTLPMFHCNGWGMTYAVSGMGGRHVVLRNIDGAEILRRVDEHGVTFMCGAPAVMAAVLDAAASWDGPIPGRDRVRVVVAGAPPPTRDRTHRDGARVGVQPDLRPHRDLPAAHDEPQARGVRRPHAGRARPEPQPRRCARARRAAPRRRPG